MSLPYLVYRVAGAVLVPALVATSALLTWDLVWFVFLTNWGGLLLALSSVLEALLVVSAYRGGTAGQGRPRFYR